MSLQGTTSLKKGIDSLTISTETPSKPKETKELKYKGSIPVFPSSSSLGERLGAFTAQTMQTMASDHWQRMEGCAKKVSLLNEGIFYQDGLYEAMDSIAKSVQTTDKTKKAVLSHLKKMEKEGAFYHGAAPTSHFTIPSDPTSPSGKASLRYNLKDKTITPSAALDAILHPKSRVFLACGEACQLSYMKALQEVLGPKKFDILFAFDSPTPFFVGASGNSTDHPMYLLIKDRVAKGPIKQGEWLFFQSAMYPSLSGSVVNLYALKHLNGSGGNWNTICLNPKKPHVTYLGLGLNPKGASHNEIEETLLSEYNKAPIGFQGLSEEVAAKQKASLASYGLAQAESLKAHKLSMEEFRKCDGGKALIIRGFDMDKIQQLIEATPEEGRLLLAAWKKSWAQQKLKQLGLKETSTTGS